MHRFRRLGRLLAATTTTSLVLTGAAVATAAEEAGTGTVNISVTNITDFHGHLVESLDEDDLTNSGMGAARLAALMDYVGQDNDAQLRTTSGDNVGGSAFVSAVAEDIPTLEALNLMDIDASAVGNHEFDKGYADLEERILPASDYPVLGANVLWEDGTPALEASTVIETAGVRVAFIGTVTQETVNKVAPTAVAGLTFTDPVAAANAEATRIKDNDEADVVIVLQHEDIQNFPGFNDQVDAAFGGDSHLRHNNGTRLAQSHEYGKVLSELEFTYDFNAGEITEQSITQYDYSSAGVAELTPDAELTELVAGAVAQSEELGARVITAVDRDYVRGSNPGTETGSNRGTESTATNMLAEANKQAMDAFLGGGVVDLGVMNAGGVRADLNAGEVTYQDAVTVQPFGNNLGYATVSGQALLDALENQWKSPEDSRPRLSLGVSDNVSYLYDPSAVPGERIITVMIDGEALDPAGEYTIAAASFLFEGGDSYFAEMPFTDVGYLDVTAFTDYLAGEKHPSYRAGQAEVGVTGLAQLRAGQSVTLELSSLSYSSAGEPAAETVTVELSGAEASAEVDNSVSEADAGYGEQGRASVELLVPADAAGEQMLYITTDAGTELAFSVVVQEGDAGAVNGAVPGDNLVDSVLALFAALGGGFTGIFDGVAAPLSEQAGLNLAR